MTRTYVTTVIDESAQSWKVMDVKGYSHFGQPYSVYQAGKNIIVRDVFFSDRNHRAALQDDIRAALGRSFWPNLNRVREFNKTMGH